MGNFTLTLRYKDETNKHIHDVVSMEFIESKDHLDAKLKVFFKNGKFKVISLYPAKFHTSNGIYAMSRYFYNGVLKPDTYLFSFDPVDGFKITRRWSRSRKGGK